MAIVVSPLFTEIRNRLGNTVLYKRESKDILRSQPSRIKNPRTQAQVMQRIRMAHAIALSRAFAPVIREGFSERPKGMTVFNAFVQTNIAAITVSEDLVATILPQEIKCSNGILNAPAMTYSVAESAVTFNLSTQECDELNAEDDLLYAGIYESKKNASRLVALGTRKTPGDAGFTLPDGWAAENVHVYGFAVSKSGRRTSQTAYITKE